MSAASPIAERYLDAFRHRRALASALVELSVEQTQLLATEDYPSLSALLAHKQQLIDALLAESVAGWRSERDRLPPGLRGDCEAILDETEQLMNQLLSLEADSTARLQQQRDVTERLLGDVNHGREAFAAYESPSDPIPIRRLDLDL
jgi:hypothetical protein